MQEYCRIMRDLREDADMTQQQVAEYLGTSQTMYARYERGANELPIRHLQALCRLYHVTADYLLGIQEETDRQTPNMKLGEQELTVENQKTLRRFARYLLAEQIEDMK